MRSLVTIIGLLIGYTLIYVGVSKFWEGVTSPYNAGLVGAG